MEETTIEQLYMSPEMEEVFERGRKLGLKQHVCPPRNIVKKIIYKVDPHIPRSQRKGWGVVNNGQLLNPTFHTEAEATRFILEGLVPANPQKKIATKIDALVVKL